MRFQNRSRLYQRVKNNLPNNLPKHLLNNFKALNVYYRQAYEKASKQRFFRQKNSKIELKPVLYTPQKKTKRSRFNFLG